MKGTNGTYWHTGSGTKMTCEELCFFLWSQENEHDRTLLKATKTLPTKTSCCHQRMKPGAALLITKMGFCLSGIKAFC